MVTPLPRLTRLLIVASVCSALTATVAMRAERELYAVRNGKPEPLLLPGEGTKNEQELHLKIIFWTAASGALFSCTVAVVCLIRWLKIRSTQKRAGPGGFDVIK
jgi:hypothetical protein